MLCIARLDLRACSIATAAECLIERNGSLNFVKLRRDEIELGLQQARLCGEGLKIRGGVAMGEKIVGVVYGFLELFHLAADALLLVS